MKERTPEQVKELAFKLLERAKRQAVLLDKKHKTFHFSNYVEDIQLHTAGYAETGYPESEPLIAVGNWNSIDEYDKTKRERVVLSNIPVTLSRCFELLGIPCEWSDEWTTCSDCGRLVRTEPDSFSWKPSGRADLENGEFICRICDVKPEELGPDANELDV